MGDVKQMHQQLFNSDIFITNYLKEDIANF